MNMSVFKTTLLMKPLITLFVAFLQAPYVLTPWCGLVYSVATPSGLRGRPEVGTDVSPWAEMVEAGAGIEAPPTSPNQFPPTSMPENLPLDYQQPTTPPNTTHNDTPINFTPNDTSLNFT